MCKCGSTKILFAFDSRMHRKSFQVSRYERHIVLLEVTRLVVYPLFSIVKVNQRIVSVIPIFFHLTTETQPVAMPAEPEKILFPSIATEKSGIFLLIVSPMLWRRPAVLGSRIYRLINIAVPSNASKCISPAVAIGLLILNVIFKFSSIRSNPSTQ